MRRKVESHHPSTQETILSTQTGRSPNGLQCAGLAAGAFVFSHSSGSTITLFYDSHTANLFPDHLQQVPALPGSQHQRQAHIYLIYGEKTGLNRMPMYKSGRRDEDTDSPSPTDTMSHPTHWGSIEHTPSFKAAVGRHSKT